MSWVSSELETERLCSSDNLDKFTKVERTAPEADHKGEERNSDDIELARFNQRGSRQQLAK